MLIDAGSPMKHWRLLSTLRTKHTTDPVSVLAPRENLKLQMASQTLKGVDEDTLTIIDSNRPRWRFVGLVHHGQAPSLEYLKLLRDDSTIAQEISPLQLDAGAGEFHLLSGPKDQYNASQERGLTVDLVTHDPSIARADRIIRMLDGRVASEDIPKPAAIGGSQADPRRVTSRLS
jgi:hypothetical protein